MVPICESIRPHLVSVSSGSSIPSTALTTHSAPEVLDYRVRHFRGPQGICNRISRVHDVLSGWLVSETAANLLTIYMQGKDYSNYLGLPQSYDSCSIDYRNYVHGSGLFIMLYCFMEFKEGNHDVSFHTATASP